MKKDNSQDERWPNRTVMITIRLTEGQATTLNIPKLKEKANLVLLSCGHYLVETNDVEQFKFNEGSVMKCRPCFHVQLLQAAVIKVNNALSNEGPVS